MAKKGTASQRSVAEVLTHAHLAKINEHPSQKRVNFDKYSPSEYAALWNLSKREVIEDIANRNGVERRKISDPKPFQYKEPTVRVLARKVKSGESSSSWFYLRIEGYTPFTTKIRMDIEGSEGSKQGKEDQAWWKKSKYAQLLEVEVRSAKAFVIQTQMGVQMGKTFPAISNSPVQFLLAALEDWGFHDSINALEFDEIGPDRLFHFCKTYFRPTEELRARFHSRLWKKAKDTPVIVSDEQLAKDAKRNAKDKAREQNCVEWAPGKPIDWNPETGTGWRLNPETLVMGDLHVLADRFELRYPRVAASIKEVLERTG